MACAQGQIRIGISGWRYPPWRGIFFPEDLPQRQELEYASREVNSIEINGSFYSLQRPESWQNWYKSTPPGFIFSIKGGRYITHVRRLKEARQPLANFFASGLLALREKLGPFLWQLPPSLRYDPDVIESFLENLPNDTDQLSRLASEHDDRLNGHTLVQADAIRPVRHAMEVRHASFQCAEFINQLRRYNVALVVADTAGKWPFMEDVTADFIYLRLHGDEELYVSGYTEAALDEWERKIKSWSLGRAPQRTSLVTTRTDMPPLKKGQGRDVFVYFDNDVKVRAPFDAMSLASRFGLRKAPELPAALEKAKDFKARIQA